MATPDPQERTPMWPLVAAVGAFVVCCGGPVLLALLATTGVGVAAHRGAPVVAAVGLIVALAIGAIVWQRRRAYACQVPRHTSSPERADETGGGFAPPRRDRARVP